MILIPLLSVPNQSFKVRLDNDEVEIQLRTVSDYTLISIRVGEESVIEGQICGADQQVYLYTDTFNGVFVWHSQDGEYPFYSKFGTTHNLYFLTNEEVTEMQNG